MKHSALKVHKRFRYKNTGLIVLIKESRIMASSTTSKNNQNLINPFETQ